MPIRPVTAPPAAADTRTTVPASTAAVPRATRDLRRKDMPVLLGPDREPFMPIRRRASSPHLPGSSDHRRPIFAGRSSRDPGGIVRSLQWAGVLSPDRGYLVRSMVALELAMTDLGQAKSSH